MADKPPLSHEEVQRILRQLEPLIAERRVVLVGGQAVAFWMRLLRPRSRELARREPLTSKDIDFEGSAQAVRRAAGLLGGTMKLASMDDNTPNTGLVVFTDADGIESEIDFIDAPLGLDSRDARDTKGVGCRGFPRLRKRPHNPKVAGTAVSPAERSRWRVALGVRGSKEHSRHGEDDAKCSLPLWQRPEVQAVLPAVGTRA